MDKLAHLIGGFGLAFVITILLKSKLVYLLSTKDMPEPVSFDSLGHIANYVVTLGIISFIIIVWEILEFFIFPFSYEDTIYDLICGLTGAFIWVMGHWSGELWHLDRR